MSFPPRPADAPDGESFITSLANADENLVQQAALQELTRGNIPESLRQLSRIVFHAPTRSGVDKKVTIWATWDYLRIGSDINSARMALSPITAQIVADHVGALLPTPKARLRHFVCCARRGLISRHSRHPKLVGSAGSNRVPRRYAEKSSTPEQRLEQSGGVVLGTKTRRA